MFVNQIGFERFCKDFFDTTDVAGHPDVAILKLLDSIPSLDPFMVRELLGRSGFRPATSYLKISQKDIALMLSFAKEEIEHLVRMAFGTNVEGASMRLATRILSNEMDEDLLPLRDTLRLTESEFADGIFSWRGFLYYKWRNIELKEELSKVMSGIVQFIPRGKMDPTAKSFIDTIKPKLGRKIMTADLEVSRILRIYENAYRSLVTGVNPIPFRNFLIDGPKLFFTLGENIGILSHISTFWNFRMRQATEASRPVTVDEYIDMLCDFDDGLSTLLIAPALHDKSALKVV